MSIGLLNYYLLGITNWLYCYVAVLLVPNDLCV
uniref:Uncharacterized protein n=1 Tax=Anguilla anguilla TaxID=7936 RepID=A0A0E9U1J2_ANGAN